MVKNEIFVPLYFGCSLFYPDPFSPSRCGSGFGSGQMLWIRIQIRVQNTGNYHHERLCEGSFFLKNTFYKGTILCKETFCRRKSFVAGNVCGGNIWWGNVLCRERFVEKTLCGETFCEETVYEGNVLWRKLFVTAPNYLITKRDGFLMVVIRQSLVLSVDHAGIRAVGKTILANYLLWEGVKTFTFCEPVRKVRNVVKIISHVKNLK